jgi:hypothetical protein
MLAPAYTLATPAGRPRMAEPRWQHSLRCTRAAHSWPGKAKYVGMGGHKPALTGALHHQHVFDAPTKLGTLFSSAPAGYEYANW